MTINFHLDWKDYFAAQEFFRRDRYSMPPERVIGGVLITFSALWFFIDDLNFLAIAGLALGLIIIFGASPIRRWAARKKWKREPLYRAEYEVSFNEDGVNFLIGQVESDLDWKYYQRLLESPEGFLLIYGKDSFNLLPKRAFPSQKSIGEFRALAAKKIAKSGGYPVQS